MTDPFDDAMERMHNAMRSAHDAFLDADAALTLALQAEREASREKGSLRETLGRLESLILEQVATIAELKEEIRTLKNGRKD